MKLKQDKCLNCGASINFDEVHNGLYICPYCRNHYHIDKLGYIEEYKVQLMFQGHLLECYLSSFGVESPMVETTRLEDSTMSFITMPPMVTLEFTGCFKDN